MIYLGKANKTLKRILRANKASSNHALETIEEKGSISVPSPRIGTQEPLRAPDEALSARRLSIREFLNEDSSSMDTRETASQPQAHSLSHAQTPVNGHLPPISHPRVRKLRRSASAATLRRSTASKESISTLPSLPAALVRDDSGVATLSRVDSMGPVTIPLGHVRSSKHDAKRGTERVAGAEQSQHDFISIGVEPAPLALAGDDNNNRKMNPTKRASWSFDGLRRTSASLISRLSDFGRRDGLEWLCIHRYV